MFAPRDIEFAVSVDRLESDCVKAATIASTLARRNNPTGVLKLLERLLNRAFMHPSNPLEQPPGGLQIAVVIPLELRAEFEKHLACQA